MHYFEQLENSTKNLLKPALEAINVPNVDIYAGELNDAANLKSNVNRLPCVWILSGDMTIKTVNTTQELDIEIIVLTAAKSARGSLTAAKGAKRPGAYDILETVRKTLNGVKIQDPFTPPEVFTESLIFSAPDEGMVIYGTNFNLKAKIRGYY